MRSLARRGDVAQDVLLQEAGHLTVEFIEYAIGPARHEVDHDHDVVRLHVSASKEGPIRGQQGANQGANWGAN